jgi:hypothetical protein
VVAGLPREVTHFYAIPRQDDRPIHHVVLEHCPEFHREGTLTPENAAFAAGYLAHLVMDVVWLEAVVMPRLFIDGIDWKPGHPNWTTYNILMARLEVVGHTSLCEDVITLLRRAEPNAWIACLSDRALSTWAMHIASVVDESGPQHVVTLLARSSDMELAQFERIVTDDTRVYEAVSPTITPAMIGDFLNEVDQRSEKAVRDYLSTVTLKESM